MRLIWPDHCFVIRRVRVHPNDHDMPDPVLPNGLSAAASALQTLERRQQVLANNLANVSTRGFKGEAVFSRLMDNQLAKTDTALDLTSGTLTETHNTLDLALEGDGFFVIQTRSGERLMRNGNFHLDAERRIVDDQGNAVMGENGEIKLPAGVVEIDSTGLISVNARPLQRLRVETVKPGTDLQHEGGTRFIPDATRQVLPPGERKVKQGFLEESNVNPMLAMTDMLTVLHRYTAAQKTISTIDSARGIAVTELAKPV